MTIKYHTVTVEVTNYCLHVALCYTDMHSVTSNPGSLFIYFFGE